MVTLLSRIKGPFGGFGIDKIPFGYQCLQQQKIVNEKWKKDPGKELLIDSLF